MRIKTSGVSGRPTMKSTARERTGAAQRYQVVLLAGEHQFDGGGERLARLYPPAVQSVASYVKQNQGAVLNGFGGRVGDRLR